MRGVVPGRERGGTAPTLPRAAAGPPARDRTTVVRSAAPHVEAVPAHVYGHGIGHEVAQRFAAPRARAEIAGRQLEHRRIELEVRAWRAPPRTACAIEARRNGEPGEPFDLLRLMPCRQIVEAVCAEQQHELMAGQPALDRPQRLDRVRRPGTARLEVGYLERGIAAHGELR